MAHSFNILTILLKRGTSKLAFKSSHKTLCIQSHNPKIKRPPNEKIKKLNPTPYHSYMHFPKIPSPSKKNN